MSGMESICDEIRTLLLNNTGTSEGSEPVGKAMAVRLLIMKLKAENRHAMDHREELRDKASAARAQLDSTNLELQNYLYEKRVYQGQVRANLEYKCVLSCQHWLWGASTAAQDPALYSSSWHFREAVHSAWLMNFCCCICQQDPRH